MLQQKIASIIILTLENKHLQYKQGQQGKKKSDGSGENVSLKYQEHKGNVTVIYIIAHHYASYSSLRFFVQ